MSYRSLKPQRDGDSSTSTSGPSGPVTTESSGSGPNLLSPNETRVEGTESDIHAKQPKRRKVPETVTRNACSNCKRARAKVWTPPFRAGNNADSRSFRTV